VYGAAAVAVGGIVAGATGLAACGDSPERALRTRFGATLPSAARVVHHWRSGPGLDRAAVWEVAPADDALVRALRRGAGLRADTGRGASGLVSDRWPGWWRPARVEALPEAYRRDEGGRHWRVWVDRAGDRLYVQWFTT
jgi:hypothetical protein